MSNGTGGGGGVMPTGWSVTGQEERTDFDATGRPVKGMLVRFKTAANVAGSVFVPLAEYQRDNVKAAIAQAVTEIEAVHNLKG